MTEGSARRTRFRSPRPTPSFRFHAQALTGIHLDQVEVRGPLTRAGGCDRTFFSGALVLRVMMERLQVVTRRDATVENRFISAVGWHWCHAFLVLHLFSIALLPILHGGCLLTDIEFLEVLWR